MTTRPQILKEKEEKIVKIKRFLPRNKNIRQNDRFLSGKQIIQFSLNFSLYKPGPNFL